MQPMYGVFYAVLICFSFYLGIGCRGGGGAPNGLVHNLLMQLCTPGTSKMKVFETCFFHTVTSQNDHPRYLKHIGGRINVFFIFFGYGTRGLRVSQWDGYTMCLCFSPWLAQRRSF